MLIITIPGPQNIAQIKAITKYPLVDAYRFNTGVRVPYPPQETLERLLDLVGENLWVDLKGRQLRIIQWADPAFGEILLNHEIEVDLPAHAHFRGDDVCELTSFRGNQIFVYPNPKYALGAGQALNIHGDNLVIKGYLTDEDFLYLEAAKKLGVNKLMLSFVESNDDIQLVKAICPDAEMYLKIESTKGMEFVNSEYDPKMGKIHLMAARDDLFTNLKSPLDIIPALRLMVEKDPEALVASRLLTSLIRTEEISLADIADIYLLDQMGYQNFMFCDNLCSNPGRFQRAMQFWNEFQINTAKR
jgi:hypothetical protein